MDDDDDKDFNEDEKGIDEDEVIASKAKKATSSNKVSSLKVNFMIEISKLHGSIDVAKLDDWIECLEIYSNIYGYSSKEKLTLVRTKLSKHVLSWLKSVLNKVEGSCCRRGSRIC